LKREYAPRRRNIRSTSLDRRGNRSSAKLSGRLEPHDAFTLAVAAGVLVAVGASASWLPAWRASRIAPAELLRKS
jgi:ABC-type lipoprotein release transport system permease subunit